jgi:SAM-dependent methyltransferase
VTDGPQDAPHDPADHAFDEGYWERHWRGDGAPGSMGAHPPNPYLERELGGARPGSALDAGCGAGAEALWLAEHGWSVTAADISAEALALAEARATGAPAAERISWVRTDLTTWEPGARFDLVTTHYAHPPGSQLDFYERIAGWVAPGGTLLVVGHLPGGTAPGEQHGHGHGRGGRPEGATATAASVTARLDATVWDVVTAEETERTLRAGDRETVLHDVVVRATRRA